MIKVTVVIPVYNVEAYLPACLDSVLGQSLEEIEIICIDDASPDRCGAILDEYAEKDKRVKVIHLPENHKQGYGRNRGEEAARGKYIYFLDSDDMITGTALEEMYEKYRDKGFEIIDVPCNQFAGQTPGTDEEIHEFCTLKYNTQFPQMKKSDVNGENAIELFKYLKSQKTFEGFGKGPKAMALAAMLKGIDKDYKNNSEIKWNFTKFIINRKGEVVARFGPTADMKAVDKFVENLLNEG